MIGAAHVSLEKSPQFSYPPEVETENDEQSQRGIIKKIFFKRVTLFLCAAGAKFSSAALHPHRGNLRRNQSPQFGIQIDSGQDERQIIYFFCLEAALHETKLAKFIYT